MTTNKKIHFKPNIFVDKTNLKMLKIKNVELKNRIKFILSLLCDFSTEVSVKFCDKSEMIQANNSFRKKNYATDVLSFPSTSFQDEEDFSYLGDILICIPVCIEQAKKAKVSVVKELEKMIIHGIVHLKGFDHERNKSAYNVMNTLEVAIHKELIKCLKNPKWC